jgi:hypothetical protein
MANEQGIFSVFRSVVNNNSNSTPIPFPDFNETVHFGSDPKTYKELIYNSRVKKTLNLSIEVLTNDSTTSRLAQRNRSVRTKVKTIPRPQNPWIIYRRDKSASSEFKGVKSWITSVIIGDRWKKESSEVLEYFVALSMLALENHQKKYGDYKYQPKKAKKSKNHQRQPNETDENISPKTMNQNLPQLAVVPPSPTNNNIPTPVSSIQHSPLTFQGDWEPMDETLYYPTPASSNQHSPATIQVDSEQMNFLTPASSNQHSPVTFQDILMEQMLLPELMDSNIDSTAMYPHLSAINLSTYDSNSFAVPENFPQFLLSADFLAALQSSSDTIPTNLDYQDFDLYPELIPNVTPLTPLTAGTTTNVPNFVTSYNLFDYDPLSINTATLFSDQSDYCNNTGRPSNE